jgi:hypothetical protein
MPTLEEAGTSNKWLEQIRAGSFEAILRSPIHRIHLKRAKSGLMLYSGTDPTQTMSDAGARPALEDGGDTRR